MSDKCVHAHLGYCSICSAAEIAALRTQLAFLEENREYQDGTICRLMAEREGFNYIERNLPENLDQPTLSQCIAGLQSKWLIALKEQCAKLTIRVINCETQLAEKDELIATLNQAMKEIVIEAHEDKVSALKAQELINRVRTLDSSPEDD